MRVDILENLVYFGGYGKRKMVYSDGSGGDSWRE